MPTATLNGIDIYFERAGSGDRLMFLNGSGSTLASSAPLLRGFTDRFDLVAHDQRGLGRTSIPDGPYEMADYAADAIALADHLEWDRFRLVGVSFGGMVAQEVAVTVPDRIERLALVCTSPGGEGGASYPLHTLADKDPEERAAIGLRILDTRFTPEWLASHPSDQFLADAMAQRAAVDKTEEQRRGERLQLEARSRHDVFARLPRTTSPTFVASGRYDGIAPLTNGEAIAGRIPNAVLRAYEGGHAFFFQDRQALPDILDFLEA
jgi:pimeloyl-ACP methyl ester carboxylesterase